MGEKGSARGRECWARFEKTLNSKKFSKVIHFMEGKRTLKSSQGMDIRNKIWEGRGVE